MENHSGGCRTKVQGHMEIRDEKAYSPQSLVNHSSVVFNQGRVLFCYSRYRATQGSDYNASAFIVVPLRVGSLGIFQPIYKQIFLKLCYTLRLILLFLS